MKVNYVEVKINKLQFACEHAKVISEPKLGIPGRLSVLNIDLLENINNPSDFL